MAVNLSPVGGVAAQFFTSTGAVLTGGKLYTYAAGTTTPAVTYTSSNGLTAWTNPVVLDAAGRVPGSGEIWLTDGINYKFVLKDANDVLIATYDNISGINSNFVAYTNSQEIQTATAGQTVFALTTMQYQPSTNSLSVFVDGVNQYGPGAQYAFVETDSTTVTFNSGLHVGAEVKFTTTQQQGAGAVDASQVTYDPPFTGSVVTNVEAKLAQTVSVKDFGAVGDGATDDTAAIQAALNATKNLYFPSGTYKITSTLTIAGGSTETNTFYGDGGYSSTILWAGSAGAVMIEVENGLTLPTFNGLHFNADSIADTIFHIGISSASIAVVRNFSAQNCLLSNTSGSCVIFGNYNSNPTYGDADVAQVTFFNCTFFDCYRCFEWQSTQALGISIVDCFFGRATSNLYKEIIYMVRGGSCSVRGTYFGSMPDLGTLYAIYVKDGWINVSDSHFEYGYGGAGSGCLHLDTPIGADPTVGTPSTLTNCRVLGAGITSVGNYILISSIDHPLNIYGCQFYGKTGGGLDSYAIVNNGGSKIVSVGNVYKGWFWSTGDQVSITSLNDSYDSGTYVETIPPNFSGTKGVTPSISPYTVQSVVSTVNTSGGACTIVLPKVGEPQTAASAGRTVTIKNESASGTTTISPTSPDTIDGQSSISLTTQYDCITLQSKGIGGWRIVSFFKTSML